MPHLHRHTLSLLLLVAAVLACGSAWTQPNPQYAHDYEFTFGLTSTDWITLTDYHEMNPQLRTTPLEDFGFSFYFFDHAYRTLSINSQGGIRFGTRFAERYRDILTPFPSSFRGAYRWKYHTPYIIPFGMSLYQGPGSYARWGVVGDPGQRKVVCEFSMSSNDSLPAIYKCQVQLSEADGSVLYLYKYTPDTIVVYGNTGMAYDPFHFITINSNTTYASAQVDSTDADYPNLATVWPQGDIRYYRLRPNRPRICANPARLIPQNVKQTTAEVVWRRNPLDAYYLYSYGTDMHYDEQWEYDTLGNPTTLCRTAEGQPIRDTVLRLSGLRPGTAYEVSVSTVCKNGDTSSVQRARFYTYTEREEGNPFDYANIYGAHVISHNGTFANPFIYDEMFEYGPVSGKSRQTVFSDPDARDTLTNNGLRKVSPDFSHSVKLGDTCVGSLTEGITYQLDVDTLNGELLLVYFALVEQSPGHDDPPQVSIEFLDSAGRLTDSCNHINFLSGDVSGDWHGGNSSRGISWKSWSKVGLDLTPFHGQRILVRLTNYDCGQGIHYGYCYYAIKSANKNLRTNTCSSSSHTVFHAPDGFAYRWYPLGNRAATLSTADSLVVTQPGYYCCWCGYKHNPACGFELRGYAGPRVPVASFRVEPLDSCGRRCRFVNESYVAQDSSLTPFPGVTPEDYLWRFDDGTTSTETNPVHEFAEGTHRVELVAMVGGGECRDSVSDEVSVELREVLLTDTFCRGGLYPFHDTLLTAAGTYIYTFDCTREVLTLKAVNPYEEGHYDTVCRGDGIWVRGQFFDDDTARTIVVPGLFGCDSTYKVGLTVREWPEPEIDIEQSCRGDAHYTVTLTPGWEYSWSSEPLDYEASYLEGHSSVRLTPSVPTTYHVGFSYKEAPFCTVTKDFHLDPVGSVTAALAVTPSVLDLDHRTLTATDVSAFNTSREWYVDDELLPDTANRIYYDLPSDHPVDSVRLMLVALNQSCQDTARLTVPVYRSQLLFPNIFTPGLPENNQFLPSGYGVSDYELWIYDRRGVLVFHTADMHEPWDGTSDGVRCQQGSYAYICFYTIASGERKQQAGVVTLVR